MRMSRKPWEGWRQTDRRSARRAPGGAVRRQLARGLSPLDPTLSAFRAGRLLLEEARSLIRAKASFAIESTLSGKTYVALIREAKARGYRFLLHYIVIGSATQAVARVALRVRLGGHHVPEEDVRRRFDRS